MRADRQKFLSARREEVERRAPDKSRGSSLVLKSGAGINRTAKQARRGYIRIAGSPRGQL